MDKHYERYVPKKHRLRCPISKCDSKRLFHTESSLTEHIFLCHPNNKHQAAYIASCAVRDKLLEAGPVPRLGSPPMSSNPDSVSLETATSELRALLSAHRNLREPSIPPNTCYGCLKSFKYDGFFEKHLRSCQRALLFVSNNRRISALRTIIESHGYITESR